MIIALQDRTDEWLDRSQREWGVLVISVLLCRTRGHTVEKILPTLFKEFPNPEAMSPNMNTYIRRDDVANIIRACGMVIHKTSSLLMLSEAFRRGYDPLTQYGIGPYVRDAHSVFVRCRIDHIPRDRILKKIVRERLIREDRGAMILSSALIQ